MFAYCGNNPVNRSDFTGLFWGKVRKILSNAWNGLKNFAKNTFGAGSSTTVTREIETPIVPDPLPITVKTGLQSTEIKSERGNSSKPISVYVNNEISNPMISSSAGMYVNIDDFTLDTSLSLDNIGVYGSLTNGDKTTGFGIRLNLSEFKIGIQGSVATRSGDKIDASYTNISVSAWAVVAAYYYVKTGQFYSSPSYKS